ncbi:MAG TPA: GTPase Era [Gemmatimonadales bacterium]|nr:GTPase Era [Gemmatimonadales bacterium]
MSQCGHIALAGVPNVGKSSLLNALVGQHLAIVSPKAQATRLPVVGLLTEHDTQMVFHDLPGLLEPTYLMQARMRAAALAELGRADVILHLHPAREAPAPAFSVAAGLESAPRAPVLTVFTKGDQISPERTAELEDMGGLVVSVETGQGLPELVTRLRGLLPEGEFEFDPDDVGTQPLRFFVVEYLREAAFEFLEEELPYAFTAEVEEFREAAHPVYIRVTLYVERESQKGIVIGQGGRTIKSMGAHARKRLESLLGAPVFLDCWVKALPNWRRNADALVRFGFPEEASPT